MNVGYDKIGLLLRLDDRILLCRKSRGTTLLILPGGCLEPGETAEQCLTREIHEELGDVDLSEIRYIGTYRDRAAGDLERIVQIALYEATLTGSPQPRSEIAELVWFGAEAGREQLSPSIRNKILPDLVARGFLSSAWRSPSEPVSRGSNALSTGP